MNIQVGDKFNRLEVLKRLDRDSNRRYYFLCKCVCGNTKRIRGDSLTRKQTQSCGCLNSEISAEQARKMGKIYGPINGKITGPKTIKFALKAHTKHMESNGGGIRQESKEYKAWSGCKERCNNVNLQSYSRYGGRGITVCSGWLADEGYKNFLDVMGRKPSNLYSLDRIDNDGGYWCGSCEECISNHRILNCRWATKKEQANNRRSSKALVASA